jgi:DNA-directed RNA polymerase specialized sigma24 family protein
LRSIKSRSNGRKRQADGNHNGYDQLEGDWALVYKVTGYFVRHILYQDREDWLHDTMLEMAKIKAKYEVTGKPLTEAGLMRVASYEVTEYWVKQRRLTTWLDCGNCSKAQRQKCRSEDLYSKCPKYHQLVSLNAKADGDGDGEPSELIEFLADDKAIDLDAWLDARRILRGLPRRLVQIAYKRYAGIPLTNKERRYLSR